MTFAPLILDIDPPALMALTDDELHARRLGLIAQEATLRAQRDELTAGYSDRTRVIRLRTEHASTLGALHQAKLEYKRRREPLRDAADQAIIDAAFRWSSATVDADRHWAAPCPVDCRVCVDLERRVNLAGGDLRSAVEAKHNACIDALQVSA